MSISLTLKTWFSPAANAESLMQSFAENGDRRLLAKLVDQHGDDLYHFLLSQSDAALAQDVSQTTWLKVIERRHVYRPKGKFKAWLFTLARNALIDELRRQQRWQATPIDENQLANDIIADNETNQDRQQQFSRLLMQLPFHQREALVLQLDGFSLQEIASITYSDPEAIKSRLRYAKKFLKSHMHTPTEVEK